MKWIAAASIVIAVTAGVVAFLRDQAAGAATARVAQLEADAQKAQADLKAAHAERDALRKESDGLKLEAQQLRSAADSAVQFLEMEKSINARLREDLAMASARLAAAGTRPTRQPDTLPPGMVAPANVFRPPPVVVRAAPGGPTSIGAAAPAR